MKALLAAVSVFVSASALAQTANPSSPPQIPAFDNTKLCMHASRFYSEGDRIKSEDGAVLECQKKRWGTPQAQLELHWDQPGM